MASGLLCAVGLSRFLVDISNSGIFVLEGLSGGQAIPVHRETVVAFVGPAPRGPVSIPVLIRSLDDYLHRFGLPERTTLMQEQLAQFFENGGRECIVVRVCQSIRFKQIEVPGPFGPLMLEAFNPGPLEHLRVSIDTDNIAEGDLGRFNLVVHRLASPAHPLVEQQEIFRGVSINPEDSEFVSDVLLNSRLVRVLGGPPLERPYVNTPEDPYVYSCGEWDEAEMITDYDLIGSDANGTGMFALNQIAALDLLCFVPGTESGDVGPVACFAAERYCRQRNAMLLFDPASEWQSPSEAIRQSEDHGFSSANAATYFPRPAARDDDSRRVSLLGAIAGKLASDDARLGVCGAIGRRQLTIHSRQRVGSEFHDRECAMLSRAGINALQNIRPGYLRLKGLVTTAQQPGISNLWSSLPMQRAALFILGNIVRGTRWAALQENNARTRAEVCVQVQKFLGELFESGALAGADEKHAGYVVCDNDINRDYCDSVGRISLVVGFALPDSALTAFRITHHHAESIVREFGWHADIALAS